MTPQKTPETKKSRKPPAKISASEAPQDSRVCVIETHVGIPLTMRANPSEDDVNRFVTEHQSRYHRGLPGGPDSELPAFFIYNAKFYESEDLYLNGADPVGEVDLTDALEQAKTI